jgi:hypothetical protein
MERVKHHYCWIKISAGRVEESAASASGQPRVSERGTDSLATLAMLMSTPPRPSWAFSGVSVLSTPVPVPAAPRSWFVRAQAEPTSTPVPVPASSKDRASPAETFSTPVPVPAVMNAPVPVPAEPQPEGLMLKAGLSHLSVPAMPPRSESAPDPERAAPMATDLMFAGATFSGAWQFERHAADGQSSVGVELQWQPVLGGRDAAIAWRHGEGRAWCADAQELLLIAFVAVGDF